MAKYYRQIIRVENIQGDKVVLVVPGWSPDQMLDYSITDFPDDLKNQMIEEFKAKGIYHFFSYVTLGTERYDVANFHIDFSRCEIK